MDDKKVHFVSLGCPKNRVDSEVMLGHLSLSGYKHVSQPQDAELIVVNTCGFIDAAKEESIDTIVEMAQYKEKGSCQKLVVAGCLSQRYASDLAKELPEVDHFLGTGNFESIARVVAGDASVQELWSNREWQLAQGSKKLPIVDASQLTAASAVEQSLLQPIHPRLRGKNALVPFAHFPDPDTGHGVYVPQPEFTLSSSSPRIASMPLYSRYLKISEGCSNTCSFCIIPKLRGPQRSRTLADIVMEAEQLILSGATELILIAQDLCAYGRDLLPKSTLAELLQHLDGLGHRMGRALWIRCMYAYPKGLSDEVIDIMANSQHIVPYLDMPLQHISDDILRSMRRGTGGQATRRLLDKLRQRLPHLTLRTTFITGLPGETEQHFQELYDFVAEMRFERVGVFTYSQEEDTPAGQMEQQVPHELAKERQEALLALAKEISSAQQQAMIGQEIDVLVEGLSEESELLLQGRHAGQAPDIDGCTYISSGTARSGDVVKICVEEAGDFDVSGPMIEEHQPIYH